jgi:site-specific DNA-cytosine methylase
MTKYKPLYALYKGLKEHGTDLPDSYGSFERSMTQAGNAGASNRRNFYQSLKDSNYDVPDTYEKFYESMFVPVNNTTSRARKIGETPMTEEDRKGFTLGAQDIRMNASKFAAGDALRYNKLKQRKQKQQKDFGRVKVGTNKTPYAPTDNVVKDEGLNTYVTSDSSDTTNLDYAQQKQAVLDERNQAYMNAIERGDIPMASETIDKNGLYDLQENIGKDGTEVTEKGIKEQAEARLNVAYQKQKDIMAQLSAAMDGGFSTFEERMQLSATKNKIDEEVRNLEALAGKESSGFWNTLADVANTIPLLHNIKEGINYLFGDDTSKDMYKAIANSMVQSNWDFGVSDIQNSVKLEQIRDKINKGEAVTKEEKEFLDANQKADKSAEWVDQYGSRAYRWTSVAGVSAPYMIDFYITGGLPLMRGMTQAFGRGAMKIAAKRGWGKLAHNIMYYTGVAAGDIIGSYAMATTVQGLKTGSDVLNRHLGTLYQDEKGNYAFGTFDENGNLLHEGGESFGKALYKGVTAAMLENYTEKMFGHWHLKSGAFDLLDKNPYTKKLADFFRGVGNKNWYLDTKKFSSKFGIGSYPEEVAEEIVNIPLNAWLVGDNSIKELGDRKTWEDIAGSMAISVGSMAGMASTPHIVRGAANQGIKAYDFAAFYVFKNRLNQANQRASEILGDEWEVIKNRIDSAPNENLGKISADLHKQVSEGKYSEEQLDAAWAYIQNLRVMRGYNLAKTMEMQAKAMTGDENTPADIRQKQLNAAYAAGQETEGENKHLAQVEYEKQKFNLASALGVSDSELENMTDEQISSNLGLDDNLDNVIYNYQNAKALYDGIMDNAQNAVDTATKVAAQRVDAMTNVEDGTIKQALVKGTMGKDDYPVYVISGNIETHDDGIINYSDSDSMIIVYNVATGRKETIPVSMLSAVNPYIQNAEEFKAQAVNEAKEKTITELSNVIDGKLVDGSQFTMEDAQGQIHEYKIEGIDEQGNCIISVDGTILPEPLSLDAIQQQYDQSNVARSVKNDQTAQEPEQIQQESQPIEDKFDYGKITNENDGKVKRVDVTDEEGKNRFPNAKAVFLIQDKGAMPKFVVMDEEGNLTSYVGKRGDKIHLKGEMTIDEYKKQRQEELQMITAENANSSMIEDNSGTIEDAEPIGTGAFGNIYNQFKGKVKEAFNFLMSHKSGDLLGVFHRDDVGDIDLVWGNEKMGLAHILGKHVGEGKDFETPDDAIAMIENVVNSGRIFQDNENRYTLMLDGVGVGIRKSFDGEKKNWVVTAVDFNRSQEEKGIVTNPTSTSHGVTEPESTAALNDSDGKDINNSSNGNENNESLTFEDGTPIPVDENGEVDLSQTDAAHAAEWYDNNLGEDADDWLEGEIKKAKKVLEQAKNKKLAGTKPSELVASKKEKEAAIADAQAHYDSAISIRDSLKERRIAKEENTPEGRRNLIEKARRKFARLKSAVNNDAEAVSQLYRDTVGSLMHRLYDSTGIDVTDTVPLTAEEYVASNLGAHSLNYEGTETSKGVKQETGLSREDFAKTQLLAADGKGTTIDALIHSLWENRPSNLESLDTQDIRNALIGVLNSGFKASEARNFVENIRIAQAENILEEQKRAQENADYAEQQKAELEAEQKAMSDEKAESKAMSEAKLDNESDNESNDLSNETDNEKINDNINDNINAPEVPEDATEENPLGAERDSAPFSPKDNTKVTNSSEERKAMVEKNAVRSEDVLDHSIGKKMRKSLSRIAKMMGADIIYLHSADSNGWYDEKTNTIYLALDSADVLGTQFVFGHEMTHEIKVKNPAAFEELKNLVKNMMGEDAFNTITDKTQQKYEKGGATYWNDRNAMEEEVVADQIGIWLHDANYAHTLMIKMSHPLLAKLHEIVNRIRFAFTGTEYSDNAKLILRSIEQAYVKTANGQVTNSETGEDVSFSLRQKPEPKKKGIGYKVFVLKDGKLYPPMVANPDGAATPVGVWLDADAAPIAGESKTGRPQVKQGGKGTQGGSGKLAYRPGWHLGVVPYAIQFNRKDAEGNKTLFPKNFVFAEVEYAADVDYQEEARQEGINPSGKYQHSLAGLKHLPTDGYYMYRTNPNPETDPWVITGAMKVNRILTRAEQADLVSKAGREPQQIQEGDIVTDDVVNSINQEIADAPKFSLKVYHGSGADFTEFDFDHMGEGAGSQAFGWGGYVTSSKEIGKDYARLGKETGGDYQYMGDTKLTSEQARVLAVFVGLPAYKEYVSMKEGVGAYIKSLRTLVQKGGFMAKHAGERIKVLEGVLPKLDKVSRDDFAHKSRNLYEVDIPEDNGSNYLDWDTPITDELIDKVAKALPSLRSYDIKDLKKDRTFDNFYKTISMRSVKDDASFNDDKAASQLLSSLGYTGIKYKAGRNFGGAEEGDTNYVIFKPEDMKITEHTKFSLKDNQGNPLNQDGTLKLDKIKSVDELTDEDFLHPTRNVELPSLPKKIADAIGTEGKPVVIKKNIFERNYMRHKDVTPELSKVIFKSALYNPDLYGQNQKKTRPYNWVLINTKDEKGNNRTVLLEVNPNKDNVEIVHWHFVNDKNLGLIKKQAIREGDQVLILPSEQSEEVGGLSNLTDDLSAAKIDNSSETTKENGEKVGSEGIKFSLKDEKIKSVAEKFGVNEDDVAMYANAVERGSTADAARARANIKRYLLQANEDKISSFKELMKYTVPVNEALKENFGDLDAMIEERRKQVEAQRNAMEAARKRAQEEEEKRQKHLDELSLIPTDELDKRYMDAIANNDESTAREMLDESARRKGYGDADSDYQGQGAWAAPSNPQYESDEARRADIENSPDVNLEDIALGYSLQPDDYFDNPRAYMNNTAYGLESAHVIKNALDAIKNGEKDVKVKVYRAVPTSVKEGKLRNGDWVTPSKKYAEMHGDNRLEGKYRIIEDEVPANQLWWDGNDANEFGFDDGKEYRYKNAKNNRKLNDLITYDNKGNVIPPSKRFNSRKNDIRFSLAGERGAAAADKAEERTTRMDFLSVARKMEEEKKDAKAIKIATGWERGADGKWRFEIPDFHFNYEKWKDNNKELLDSMDDKDYRNIMRYEKEFYEDLSPIRKKNFDELRSRTGYKIKQELTLGDVLEGKGADTLFKYYPELRDVKFKFSNLGADTFGIYNNKTKTIEVNDAFLYSPRNAERNLQHEVQHVIQHLEGFAKGGNEFQVRGEVKKKFSEVIKQIRQLRAEGKEDEAKAIVEKNRGLYNAYTKNDDYNSYKSLAGEVEARNVQERMNMTPEERRKSLAESTEDVARKDQIFLGVGDVSFSLRDMADGKESGAAYMAEDLKSLNTPDEVDDAINTAIEDMPSGWKMANKKMIHIAQALGENRKAEIAGEEPKFSLKEGTLIKAGTYFSGGGLVEEGLKGIIDPVVAVEYDEKISGVYRNNFGQHIVTADVRDVDPKELVKQIDGEVEYFHASPVCKNYSQAKSNHAEVELDKETAASTAEFINAVKPKVVTIENVKGYKDSEAMKIITDALDANGYTWDADVYNAADYGGYTNRERLIVRAVRDGKLPEKPKKMAHKSGWYEAVADIIPTLTEKKNGVAPWMDVRLKADGIDWRNIDKPLYVMGSAYADGKIPHAFADELLPTLRTKSGDVIVMPDGKVYRALGRVLARVSGVSDDYKMPFSENLSHTIIGNGIPTQLTEHVIAPLLQNTLRPTTTDDGNTKFSLRGSTPYDKQMEEWMEKNHLEKGAVPMEKPIMKEGENIFDYANRMVEWTRNQNLWKTAPKQTGFQDALDKWKADNGLSPNAYPPVRPHRENYSTEIGYAEDLEEYNKKKKLWKSAPKPKDFDLSVDLEDMNKQLRNIRRAVLNQKNYDQRTVKAVSDLVRKMLNIGWGDGLSRGKVGNLLSAAKNATGANDVKKYLDKAMGILAENYLNRLSTAYDNLINTKGARADQSGVIKMGSLDAKGQAFMSEYKKAINMDDKSLNNYIANIEEDSAKNEDNVEMNDYRLAGIQAAIMYKQQIGGNDADISELQRQIDELKNKKGATKEDKDLLKSLEKKLFENKFDRITMYENLLNNIQRMVKESKGRAKEFREQIAEHKNEILHRANLDLEGVDSTYYDTTTAKKKFVNNDLQRAVFSSTYTFEQFLKFFGKHSANGEGRLYNYFHKLNQDALDEEQLYNEMNRNALDEKTKELFGKNKFMNLVGIDGKGMKEMDVEVTDYSNKETGKRTIHLKQGQMLYIYLVNKETDGEMKLRAMGITEEDVTAIEENLDPRVKAMGEWLQDEYLPECQRRYQATHTKFFGAPMKEVENYFPLAINNRARNVKEDVNQDSDAMSQLAGTSTGAIVTRRVNVIPLDIENADAFEVAFNHLQEMEEWSAMLPFRQDINTLLSYTHFRNQVQNMSSVAYGSGKTLWDEFKQTAQIAAGTYKPKVNSGMMDSRIAAAMGGIAVAKISGRLWTAIKQSQSATVFLPECDFTRFVKNGVNPYGSWKWAMENIPDFRKRVENMTYGDVKLRQYLDELEKWHDWTKTISKIGMAPNILVDGITCAVGARSVYETEVNRLTKLGYPKEKAEEKAYYKAVAAYNKTQQSSGGMYLSPMQVDRTYVSAALSLFKNANYAYGRMQIEACRGLARTYDLWGGKHKTTLIESMTRQIMEEDGLDENTARTIAKATYNRTFRQSIGRLINFATLVPVTWALYKVLPYLLTGDDDDKKKDMIEEAVLKGFATSLSDNYVIPFASNILNAGLKVEDGKPTFDPDVFRYQNLYINPATSDLANIYSMVGNQKWYSVANKLGMLGVQSLIGFNPETVGALYQALSEADKDNGNTAKEWQIGILKAISAPEESIRELYMDELGLKSGDIKKIPLAELEKRYAERQINRDNLLSQVFMDAETFNGYVDKYQKSFEKKIKDKMDKWDEYDKKKADEFFDTTSDPKLKGMMEKKRTKDANAAADEQIAKEGLNQEKKGKEPSEEAYDAVKMSIDVAEDNAISTYNKVLNKRYAALNDEYNNQTDAMKYIFMSKHPYFKAYKDLESEYTTYGKKMKELKEKLVSADGYDAKQTILKQIRAEREKFSELQSKVR